MTAIVIVCALAGACLWAAFLYGLHLIFARQARRDIAAGAVFRRRIRTYVYRGNAWS